MKEQPSKPENATGATTTTTKSETAADTAPAAATQTDTVSPVAAWHDPWVKKLCGGDNVIAETVLIAGYLGDSPDAGMLRVYFDPYLTWAVDVPTDGIAHREEIPRAFSPLGGSYLWIAKDSWEARKPYQLQQVCSKD